MKQSNQIKSLDKVIITNLDASQMNKIKGGLEDKRKRPGTKPQV